MNALTYALPGYLLGSLPFAVIVSKVFGLDDPRSFGSKNPGATNVLRSGHKLAALLTLLGDAAKGWVAMWLARHFGSDDTGVAAAGLGAFLGHVFPVFLKFRGGKGVATALGVLAGFSGWLALVAAVTWGSVAAIFRYSSLAALAAAAVAPVAAWFLVGAADTAAIGIVCALLFWRHKDNIKRLLAGTESKIGSKKKASSAA